MVQVGKGGRAGAAGLLLRSSRPRSQRDYARYILTSLLLVGAFYAGVITGLHAVSSSSVSRDCDPIGDKDRLDAIVRERVNDALSKEREKDRPRSNRETKPRFGKDMGRFAHGLAKTSKKEFLELYDYGLPESYHDDGNGEVLILYNAANALPLNQERANAARNDEGIGVPLMTAHEATENCETMNVVNTQAPGNTKQCTAVVGNYESYFVQRWMRMPEKGGKLDSTAPLRIVGRGVLPNGVDDFKPPQERHIKSHWKLLRTYLETLDDTVKELKPIVKRIARRNTVVVMVVNFGQSTLLTNFVCSSKAKGFDISNVLLFATDEKTLELAKGLGLATYYDEKNFSSLPTQEAKSYGDRTFVAMMYAKVVTVQLVNMMGYDLLFQDVDIVWYKDPLTVFHDKNDPLSDYDILFQDDGARSLRYAPYSANSGFYYVRYNDRTRYLLTSLLYSGDLIMATDSHQQAFNALLIEHSSLYGLKVKTLKGNDFPGGFHFHRRRDLMKTIVQGSFVPWIFHMSWTKNKDNKLLFFRQMEMWYVQDQCVDDRATSTLKGIVANQSSAVDEFVSACCSATPLFSCHYSDKPSTKPCNDKAPIDKGGRPFWPVS